MSWWTERREAAENKIKETGQNVAAVGLAPFTAGASLALYKDNNGYTLMDHLRGKPDVDEQNQINISEAEKNRQWQEKMSNSAYQRGYTDLLMAGLNPNLAGGGGAASTPTGAQASSVGLPDNPMTAVANAATTASTLADVGLKAKQAGKTIAETKNIETETRWLPRLNQAKINLDNATTDLQKKQIITEQAKAMNIDFDNKMKEMNVRKRSSQWEKELEHYKEQMTTTLIDAGFDNTTIGTIIRSIGKTVNAVSPFVSGGIGDTNYNYNNTRNDIIYQ